MTRSQQQAILLAISHYQTLKPKCATKCTRVSQTALVHQTGISIYWHPAVETVMLLSGTCVWAKVYTITNAIKNKQEYSSGTKMAIYQHLAAMTNDQSYMICDTGNNQSDLHNMSVGSELWIGVHRIRLYQQQVVAHQTVQ